MDERVWRLPGPRGFVREVVAEHRRGRHVATVLPEALSSDAIFTDSLAVAVLDDFANQSVVARRVFQVVGSGSLLQTFCQALIFDDQPATIPDLLNHPEVRDTVAVVVAGDLRAPDRNDLSRFLHRVELESHAGDPGRRLSIVAILGRNQLPNFAGGASSDIAMTSIWWWARVARWDVAAHVAGLPERGDLTGVLEDVRAETVVEVARWDLDLAEQLSATWSGEPGDLPSLLKDWRIVPVPAVGGHRLSVDALRPPELLLESWDERAVESWHHYQCVAGCALAAEPERLSRVLWAAQARVLLPWIEERRADLHSRLTEKLGAARLASVLHERFDPPMKADSLVEIGTLDKVVRMIIGATDVELRDAARRLRDARNCLAHMQPLSLGEQANLLAACQCLL
jgi:hypothetical protein